MSNDTIQILPVVHVTDTLDSGSMPFTRDKLELGPIKMEVYTPEARPQHVSMVTWGKTTIDRIDPFLASTGEVCTTLHLDVDGRSIDLALWGVTLDALASAVEAAQR